MASTPHATGDKFWYLLQGGRMASIPHVLGGNFCWKGDDELERRRVASSAHPTREELWLHLFWTPFKRYSRF